MTIAVRDLPAGVSERFVRVAGLDCHVARGGQGPAVIFLHDSLGNWGWLPLYAELATRYDVIAPDLPGFGQSQRPNWARHPRDLAILVGFLIDELEVERPVLAGVGFGGWVAAELAAMRPRQLAGLVLAGAAGIKPREGQGEIADQMLRGPLRYGLGGFRDADSFRSLFAVDQHDVDDVPDLLYHVWDFSTEMTARVCWKPWMFSLELPHVLPGIVTPTKVIWGAHDALFPIDIGRQYAELLPDAELIVAADAGHWVDLEAPSAIVAAIDKLRSAK